MVTNLSVCVSASIIIEENRNVRQRLFNFIYMSRSFRIIVMISAERFPEGKVDLHNLVDVFLSQYIL